MKHPSLRFQPNRRVILAAFDIFCFALVTAFYYLLSLRASSSMPVDDLAVYMWNAGIQLAAVLLFRLIFRVYRNIWRYANTKAYFELALADACGGALTLLAVRLAGIYRGLWQAVTIGTLSLLVALTARFVYALFYQNSAASRPDRERAPVVIVGAGRLGIHLAEDLQSNPNSGYEPRFFADVNGDKVGNRISGLEVYAPESSDDLIRRLGIRNVIIAIANAESEHISDLYYHYRELDCTVKVYDTLVSGSASGKAVLRDFSIEDLLFRKPLDITDTEAFSFYRGRTVLVTGGGGSIGSEICRQLAACSPKKLVIFDIYENNAYDIQQELLRKYGGALDLSVEIGSVRDEARLDSVFRRYRPQIVFHAAAHKHVPLMEGSACEAVKNNVFGTRNVADAAEKHGTERFILISTDKAVNPTSIMGASKRLCEMIVQSRSDSSVSFSAVRFGNVLGSNGSVIPLFRRQIAEGGPVTITDRRIIRYFMTIPEASQLVLQAGAMAGRGELFVLDMGKPVRIYDLAVNMIRLSGLTPGEDIEIKEIGLRPGEKLYEELLMKSETLDKTGNNLIFIERDAPCTREAVAEKLRVLEQALREDDPARIRAAIASVVPTFCEAERVNAAAAGAEEMKLAEQSQPETPAAAPVNGKEPE